MQDYIQLDMLSSSSILFLSSLNVYNMDLFPCVLVTRIKNDTGVQVRIPSDTEPSNIIRIEGSPEGVAAAKQELMDMVHKMVCTWFVFSSFCCACVLSAFGMSGRLLW